MILYSRISKLVDRDQIIIIAGIFILVLTGWFYIYHLNSNSMMMSMSQIDSVMPQYISKWGMIEFSSAFIMWSVMMMAMMLPSTIPITLIFYHYNKKKRIEKDTFVPTWIFIFGYIFLWILVSFIFTIAQFTLHNFSLISPEIRIISPLFSGMILIGAGAYQFTPIKDKCNNNCLTPFSFITENWRHGNKGALIMGMHHGLYCIGCCWFIMILLFVAGVMNLLWIIIIALYLFFEKTIITGFIGKGIGFLLIFSGMVWIVKILVE